MAGGCQLDSAVLGCKPYRFLVNLMGVYVKIVLKYYAIVNCYMELHYFKVC